MNGMNVMGHLTSFFFGSNVEQFVVFLENFFSSILLTCFYLGLLHYEKMDENVKMDT